MYGLLWGRAVRVVGVGGVGGVVSKGGKDGKGGQGGNKGSGRFWSAAWRRWVAWGHGCGSAADLARLDRVTFSQLKPTGPVGDAGSG